MTELQKHTAQAITSVFETGSVHGDYSAVSVAKGDRGTLSYGKHQATLTGGSLYRLLKDYCAAEGALHASALAVYLDRIEERDATLRESLNLRSLLRLAGADPVMKRCQDEMFDRDYWVPALNRCKSLGFIEPLSAAVVYDSTVHGSWRFVAGKSFRHFAHNAAVTEREWISHYVGERHKWMSTHKDPLLKSASKYRMPTFTALISVGNWELALPITVRGIEINEEALGWTQSS